MKILHLIGGGDVGGAKTHVLSLLSGLRGDISVRLISFREGSFAESARTLGLDVRVFEAKNPFSVYKSLKSMVLSEHFDIIHCHGARGNMIGAMLRAGLKIPVVTTVHSDYRLDYLGRPLGRLTYGMINKVALRVLPYHIGVSDPVTDMLIDRGFPVDRLFTIYNGLDFRASDKVFDRAAFLKSCGLIAGDGDVVAGIAARLSPVKDISTLLRAFAEIYPQVPQLKLLIAGDGELDEQLKKQAHTLGIDSRVCFAGWINDMDAFYSAIDINLLTSLSETFPYVITEGARFARATISSRVGGVPELIDSGINGFLFNPEDYLALSQHLQTLSEDAGLRVLMGQKLRHKAAHEFSFETMVKRQLEIYTTILRRSKREAPRRDGVTVCGAYGCGNIGDDAILEAIVGQMRSIDPDMPVRVLSRSPKATQKAYRVNSVYTFNIFAFSHSLMRSKLYINGGGSLIQDVTSRRSLWFYLYTIMLANLLGCRVMMYGCGIGPVTKGKNRAFAAWVMNRFVHVITLREDNSLEELKKMGVSRPNIHLAADPTLVLPRADDAAVDSQMLLQGLPVRGRYICFAVRLWPGYEDKAAFFGQAADYAYHQYGLTPVFLPIEHVQDVAAARMAAQYVTCPHYIIEETGTARVAMGMLSRMQVLVAMRLHALVFAAAQGVPLVGAVYDYKVSAFLHYIGQDLYENLRDITFETLTGFIDTAVARSGDKQHMLDAVTRLRDMEQINTEQARKLLEEK